MTASSRQLAEQLQQRFGEILLSIVDAVGEVTIELASENLLEVATALRDEAGFAFEILVDLCGVDYAGFGKDEWVTGESSSTGFSRGVDPASSGRLGAVTDEPVNAGSHDPKRFAAVYHLLSIRNNRRLRLRVFAPEDELPVVPSVISVWNSANWYEREAFDLYGIVFDGHPDLRRLLTDYGFIGHPFRKDFPLSGNVEVIYDAEKGRVVYQPVSIEPRVLVPKVIRAGKVESVDLTDVEAAAEDVAEGQAE
jgi:NADH-quinone oxidoreductase subunit C